MSKVIIYEDKVLKTLIKEGCNKNLSNTSESINDPDHETLTKLFGKSTAESLIHEKIIFLGSHDLYFKLVNKVLKLYKHDLTNYNDALLIITISSLTEYKKLILTLQNTKYIDAMNELHFILNKKYPTLFTGYRRKLNGPKYKLEKQ